MAELIGALLGTFVISRVFWLLMRGWLNSVSKAVALNVICAAVVLPLDVVARGDPSYFILYVGCQVVVLFYDVVRIRRAKVPA
jgi:hypothetical protein